MLTQELQTYLRQFDPLRGIVVDYKSQEAGAIAPFLVRISGLTTIYGQAHYFETELDLREMGSGKDLEKLAVVLIEAIERAEVQYKQ